MSVMTKGRRELIQILKFALYFGGNFLTWKLKRYDCISPGRTVEVAIKQGEGQN